jgi:hypothetical protein
MQHALILSRFSGGGGERSQTEGAAAGLTVACPLCLAAGETAPPLREGASMRRDTVA